MAAPACNARTKAPANTRTFAKTSELNGWQEYRNGEGVPELGLDGGMSAQFWQDKSKSRTVYVVQPGQDYWTYTRYCFSADGGLEDVDFEIRTPLGWGSRAEGSVSGDRFEASKLEFFNLKSGKTIARPEGVGDTPAALRPMLYLRVNDLPFAPMLTTATKPHRPKRVELSSTGSNKY
jgi:hypothetical protein